MKLEEITWIDSAKSWSTGWYSLEYITKEATEWSGTSNTVGYVVYEDDRVLVLAQTLDNESDKIANMFLLYKPCILNRKELT